MKNRVYLVIVLGMVLVIGLLGLVLSQNKPAIYQASVVDASYMESLRLKANVGCLQDSQCSEGYECVNSQCLNSGSINLCKDVPLWTPTRRLGIGDSISNIKEVVTGAQLPDLLADGEIVEIVDNKLVEHLYSPAILIGENKIEKEDGNYLVKSNSPLLLYRLAFSKTVDFSSKNIRGQVLRILGKEYTIGDNSDNSIIYLTSDSKQIKLEDKKNMTEGVSKEIGGASASLIKGEGGGVNVIEIALGIKSNSYENKDSLNVNEKYADSAFNAISLSFNSVDNDFADVSIGGNCV